MIIGTNVQALISLKSLNNAGKGLNKASNRISSGKKLNSSKDNPNKFSMSTKMKSQIKSLEMADKNSNDAISLIQTMEGALGEIQNIIQRMREIAVQGASDVSEQSDREKIQMEIEELLQDISSLTDACEFNGVPLLRGSLNDVTFKIGIESDKKLTIELPNINTETLGFTDILYDTTENCSNAISTCNNAIELISSFRSRCGAMQNQLNYVIEGLQTTNESMQSFLSIIQDADIAEEMVNYTTKDIVSKTAISMLAQANERPNELLSLLK